MSDRRRRRDLAPIAAGMEKRAGALLDAHLYNALIDYADKMEVDLSWVVRQAFREFVARHADEVALDPKQLALKLKRWQSSHF